MSKLDRYDLSILAELQRDARISNQELAERIGLSPSLAHGGSSNWRTTATSRARSPCSIARCSALA